MNGDYGNNGYNQMNSPYGGSNWNNGNNWNYQNNRNGGNGWNYQNNGNGGNGWNGGNGSNSGRRNKKRAGFGIGLLVGIISGGLALILILSTVLLSLMKSGYIHIGINGEVYVQSEPITDEEGIGSQVESKLNSIDSLLDSFYFDDVDDQETAEKIYKAYIDSYGDKYTVYYTPEEYKSLVESTTGKFYGIGAVCQKSDEGGILVVDIYKECSGYKAGLRAGDRIIKVDDTDIKDKDLSSAVAMIKGEKGTTVNLQLIRGSETLSVTVTRDEVQVKTVSYEMMENNIGYISILQFEEVTTAQFKSAVADLTNQGMKGLVIDIRSNPGGLLSTVVDILDYILPKGLIVYTQDKDGNKREYKGNDDNELNVPMAVLVNGNSASASEIFAGAVQDYEKGTIIGTQTFGKGIVQTIKPLTDGSAVKFTIAKYFTPKGQDIHGKGVTPDVVVELNEDSDEDNQLNTAIEEVKKKI